MTFPVCDIFYPTMYEGQQCYRVDVKKIENGKLLKGKRNGLMLMIDVDQERSYNIFDIPKKAKKANKYELYLGEDVLINQNLAHVHIGTLTPHSEEGPGDYVMTSIKQITGTEGFLAWPKDKRECALEDYEDCQMNRFKEQVSECGCAPFHLMSAAGLHNQV